MESARPSSSSSSSSDPLNSSQNHTNSTSSSTSRSSAPHAKSKSSSSTSSYRASKLPHSTNSTDSPRPPKRKRPPANDTTSRTASSQTCEGTAKAPTKSQPKARVEQYEELPNVNIDGTYKCPHCHKTFTNQGPLSNHLNGGNCKEKVPFESSPLSHQWTPPKKGHSNPAVF